MWKDQKDILLAFNACGVEYLVVGGHAVSEHAEPRATKVLDIFIGNDAQNAERVFRALVAYGASMEGLSPLDFCSKSGECFQISVEPMRVDVLQSIDGISFEQAWKHRFASAITSDRIPTYFISRHDLILNKLSSGRLRDLADVEALRDAAPENAETPEKPEPGDGR